MNTAAVIIEFFVTGIVGGICVLLFLMGIGKPIDVQQMISGDSDRSLLVLLAIPALYYLGIGVHHASWRVWRPWFHRRYFKRFVYDRKYKHFVSLAEEAFSNADGYQLEYADEYEKLKLLIEWCRFKVYQDGAEQARREYLKQHQLYRITYGPLAALGLACLGLWVQVIREGPESGVFGSSLVGALLLSLLIWLCVDCAKFRALRMWKYSCMLAKLADESTAAERQSAVRANSMRSEGDSVDGCSD